MPLDTVLCLDTSGSMGINNNEGISQLKAAASKFLDGVEDTARQAGLQVTSCFLVFKALNELFFLLPKISIFILFLFFLINC